MRRRTLLVALGVVLGLPLSACQSTDPERTEQFPEPLDLPCRVVLAADAGEDGEITRLQQNLSALRSATAAEHLGYRFVARARLTNDAGLYTVAEQAAACIDSLQSGQASALLLRGHVLHQMHRFAEAEAAARQLVATREFVLDYGLLGDALMEQGKLDEAAAAYQKMLDLKPFYQSYTRAAHLRWLRGDLAGAMRLMHNAVRSASPRDAESVAWAYARLGFYELQRGRLADAARMADSALSYVPGYAAALLLRGRVLLASSGPAPSLEPLRLAAAANPLPEYLWFLADALRLANQHDEATRVETEIARSGRADDSRTLALFLATRHAATAVGVTARLDPRGDATAVGARTGTRTVTGTAAHMAAHTATRTDAHTAVDLARAELEKRRDIFTADALAWALFAAGETHEAAGVISRALAEGTRDARLFLHAAAIAAKEGRTADAARWTRQARTLRFTLLPSELALLDGGITHTPARK